MNYTYGILQIVMTFIPQKRSTLVDIYNRFDIRLQKHTYILIKFKTKITTMFVFKIKILICVPQNQKMLPQRTSRTMQ